MGRSSLPESPTQTAKASTDIVCLFYFLIFLMSNVEQIQEQCGQTFEKKKGRGVAQLLDDSHVVPHNKFLLLKYGCHINVEYVFGQKANKYIFKYFLKGSIINSILDYIAYGFRIRKRLRQGTTDG
jgi:hypothetical protein